jgi:hypothetical protein
MSPGRSRTMKKTTSEIPIRVGIVTRTRLRTYPPTAYRMVARNAGPGGVREHPSRPANDASVTS